MEFEPIPDPTTEQLLAVVGAKYGQLQISHDWLEIQLNVANARLANAGLEQAAFESERLGREQERQILLEKLHVFESPAPTGPNPRRELRKAAK